MFGCKPMFAPLVVNEKLKKDDGRKKINETLYRNLVERLLYLSATRPYICIWLVCSQVSCIVLVLFILVPQKEC